MQVGLPGPGQEAGDALDVDLLELTEVQLGQVQVGHGLQDLHRSWPLQRQQGAVIVLNHLHAAILHQSRIMRFELRAQGSSKRMLKS